MNTRLSEVRPVRLPSTMPVSASLTSTAKGLWPSMPVTSILS